MRYLLKASGIAAAIALIAVAPSAVAQESTSTLACQDVGVSAPEPLGDHEGHSIGSSLKGVGKSEFGGGLAIAHKGSRLA